MASKTTLNAKNLEALGAERLASIARGRGFIDGQKQRAFVADLEAQRRAVREHGRKVSFWSQVG